jgi:uncharacterized membrane protein (Fun14 family)
MKGGWVMMKGLKCMLVLMGVLLLATSALAKADVLKKKTLMLRDGASNTIMILCIDKYKFIQTIIYSPNGNFSVSLIQMLEPTPTGGKPAECYRSNTTS